MSDCLYTIRIHPSLSDKCTIIDAKVLVYFKYKIELIQLKMRFFSLQYHALLIPIY